MSNDILRESEKVLRVEYSDGKGLKALFGFSRSYAYELEAAGKIRSVCIKKRGAKRGRRLFNCESIREFLRSLETTAVDHGVVERLSSNDQTVVSGTRKRARLVGGGTLGGKFEEVPRTNLNPSIHTVATDSHAITRREVLR